MGTGASRPAKSGLDPVQSPCLPTVNQSPAPSVVAVAFESFCNINAFHRPILTRGGGGNTTGRRLGPLTGATDEQKPGRGPVSEFQEKFSGKIPFDCHVRITLPLKCQHAPSEGGQIGQSDKLPLGPGPDIDQDCICRRLKNTPRFVGRDVGNVFGRFTDHRLPPAR